MDKDRLALETLYEQVYTMSKFSYAAPPDAKDDKKEIFYSNVLKFVNDSSVFSSQLQQLNIEKNDVQKYNDFWQKVRQAFIPNAQTKPGYKPEIMDNDILWSTLTEYLVSQVRNKDRQDDYVNVALAKYDKNLEYQFANASQFDYKNPDKISFHQYINQPNLRPYEDDSESK